MPDREIAQLVLQVDANIAVAQRELQNLARVVRQSTGDMNNSLATTEVAHQRLGRAFGQTRIAQMELSHVVTASVDAYAAGFSPLRIMTLEMGRLAEAATFLGGGGGGGVLGKLAGFMGGPWGIAVLLGVSVLSQLIGKMGDSGDSVESLVDKMRKHAAEAGKSKIADAEWAQSIDGLIERTAKITDELKKRLKAEEDLDAQTLRQVQHAKAGAEQALQLDKTRLANLQRQLAVAQSSTAAPNAPGAVVSTSNTGQIQALKREIEKTSQDIVKQQQGIAGAQQQIVNNTIAVGEEQGRALADSSAAVALWAKNYSEALHVVENAAPEATTQITEAFETLKRAFSDAAGSQVGFKGTADRANDLARDLVHGKISVVQYTEAMKALAKSLEAVVAAAKKGNAEFGKQIGFADAEAIAKGAGLTVTSGYRSSQHQADLYNDPSVNRPGNPVARPGSSAHEGINGKWALDIAFAPGLTAATLKKLYGDQGVSLSAVYKEKGHFHIEGSRSQAAADEAAARRGEVSGIHQQGAFEQASDRLDQELLQAKQQLTGDYHAQAEIASKQVDAETKKLLDSIQEQEDLGKATGYQQGITSAQGNILIAKAQELAAARKAAIAEREQAATRTQQLATLDQHYQNQLDDLRFDDELATTNSEHRQLQLQIIDILYEQKEAALRKAKADAEAAHNAEEAARLQEQINRLPQDKARAQVVVKQGTLSPLEQWEKSIPKTAAEINEALQSIEVHGIDSLADAIAGVVTGTESLGKAFKNIANEIIADIVRMTIRMLIFKAISSIFGGGLGGGSGLSGSELTAFGGARAAGGPVSPGQAYLVGERGPELFVPGANGTIVPRSPRISMAGAANSNEPIELIIRSAPSDDAWVKVDQISAHRAGQAVKVSVDHTNQSIRTLVRPKLMGG